MSDSEPVILEGIPVFTGDLALLDTKVSALAEDGAKIAEAAGDIHSSFGGLQAFYRAPEADQLFATTKPVADRGAALKSDLATITGALGTYSDDAYPLVEKLRQLKRDAGAFLVKANADDEWREDGDLVEENNRRRDEIAETWAAFQAVERACYNKIISLVPHGTPLTTGDGSGGKGMYGYDAEALKQAKGLPWGDPVKESTPWYHVHEHTWDFVKGFAVDGVWATVKGLGTLVGFDGWDAAKQAWTGLGNLTTGVILTIAAPHVLWLTPEDKLPGFARDARNAMKETGKALIAYDQWGENPARAGGAVTFNVLTTVFTGGAGGGVSGAGKAAVSAKALSFANKAGRFVDPTTYLFKGAGAGLTKISDVMAGLRGTGNIEIPTLPPGAITLPDGGFKLADGTLHLPEGAAIPDGAFEIPRNSVKLPAGAEIPAGAVDLGDGVAHLPEGVAPPAGSLPIQEGALKLPEGTTALPEGTYKDFDAEGNVIHLDRQGNILGEDGTLKQHHTAAQRENPTDGASVRTDADSPLPRTPAEQSALVGAGARGGSDPVRLSSDLGDTGRIGDDVGDVGRTTNSIKDTTPLGSRADELGHGPSASHESPAGHGDGPGGDHDGPSAGDRTPERGGDGVPGGSGDAAPPLPHSVGSGSPGAAVPDGPRGDLPDGSWAGENGLRLDREENSAANDFIRRSADAEPLITGAMQGIAGKINDGQLIGLEYRLKGDSSLKRKLATDLLEDSAVAPSRVLDDIKDSIRYTMEIPSRSYTQGVQQAVTDLQTKGFENVTFKNTWESAGYKGINSTWRDPVSGQIFELQFHTVDSFVAKMDGHALYEMERLPGNSPAQLAAIRAEQSELFGKVPVPRDAGGIRLGAHGTDDAASNFGTVADPTPGDLPSVADDTGGLSDNAADPPVHGADNAPDGTKDGSDPGGGWGGAGWVEQPSAYAAGVYESLRATPNHIDIPMMSRNTGIDKSVLRQVKSHMIRSQYDIVLSPGEWRRGSFTPRDDLAGLWDGARKGTLSEAQIREFRNLMTHEYVESQLMKAGLPYLKDQAGLWRREADGTYADGGRYSPKSLSAAGAHDLAPHPVHGGFGRAWQKLGLKHPRTKLVADLSNLDDFVKDVFQELRAKGLNLK